MFSIIKKWFNVCKVKLANLFFKLPLKSVDNCTEYYYVGVGGANAWISVGVNKITCFMSHDNAPFSKNLIVNCFRDWREISAHLKGSFR